MSGKDLQLKTTTLLVFFLWLVKSEKLVNNRIVDHLEKCGHIFNFQFFSQLYLRELLGLLAGQGATRALALDISKAFDRVWHAGLLHKLMFENVFMGI